MEDVHKVFSGHLCSTCGGPAPEWKCSACGESSTHYDPLHRGKCKMGGKMQPKCQTCGEAETKCVCL